MKKVVFFLLAFFIGFFLVTTVVYSEYEYDEENQLISDIDDDDPRCPTWLINLSIA